MYDAIYDVIYDAIRVPPGQLRDESYDSHAFHDSQVRARLCQPCH